MKKRFCALDTSLILNFVQARRFVYELQGFKPRKSLPRFPLRNVADPELTSQEERGKDLSLVVDFTTKVLNLGRPGCLSSRLKGRDPSTGY